MAVVTAAAAVGFLYGAVDRNALSDPVVWAPLAAAAVLVVAMTLWPWKRGDGLSTDLPALAWTGVVLWGLWAASWLFATSPPTAAFAATTLIGVAILARPIPVGVMALSSLVAYYLASRQAAVPASGWDLWVPFAALAAIVLIAAAAAAALNQTNKRSDALLTTMTIKEEELERRSADIERLYDISSTLGAGHSRAEVLPELVAKVANSVNAKVGLVAMYNPAEQALEVISPIWVAGHALRAEGYILPLTQKSFGQQVFVSDTPEITNSIENDSLLVDLDATSAAAVPLHRESRTIGILMVIDKEDGPFVEADLRLLGSLAAPAALILEHFSRFEEAKATSEKMTELAQLKSDFVSVTSHELRTPLTSIIGSLATLARPELAPTDPGAQQLLATARRQADRLKRLIEDLLTASRLDNQSLPQRPQSIDLAVFVRDAVRSIPAADEVVSLDLSSDIPPLEADPDHVRRIVVNLVENALKYAPGSKVDVVAKASGTEVWVSVIDHGPGVPYELHDHIFDRFTQVGEHATRVKGGTGLGLSIVRGLAEAMGGRVWYEPTVGGGATFSLALPLQRRRIA
jgi:signal transduction histidine kinase